MAYENAGKSIETLPPAVQLRLVAELVNRLSGDMHREPRISWNWRAWSQEAWQAVDVDENLRRERSPWNG